MEGLLVILVSAISLSFFLQQQQAEGKRSTFNPYFFWDDWAEQEEFIFSPPTPETPMSIVATISPYTVYIYAKPKPYEPNALPEDRFYTEIRIPLRYTLAVVFGCKTEEGWRKYDSPKPQHCCSSNTVISMISCLLKPKIQSRVNGFSTNQSTDWSLIS